ncbi:hypothetical protein BpHYR1_023660, partial [Brachionus plicatilis]
MIRIKEKRSKNGIDNDRVKATLQKFLQIFLKYISTIAHFQCIFKITCTKSLITSNQRHLEVDDKFKISFQFEKYGIFYQSFIMEFLKCTQMLNTFKEFREADKKE